MHILLILNPKAGNMATARVALVELAAILSGHTLEVALPTSATAAEAVAREAVAARFDRILVGGGDGTVNSVLPALVGSETALGILPVGTVNVLAREFRIPLTVEGALKVALHGAPRRVDLGQANGKPFALMAGLGFDARVVADVVPELKKLIGPFAYVTAGLQALAVYKSSQFRISMDDVTVTVPAWLMIVGNAAYYTYELALSPDARMDDGLLDVCIFGEQTALDRVTQLMATAVGLHTQHPNVTLFRTRSLSISADPPVHLQLDGDHAGSSPVEITLLPKALTVMTPR
ncbi:MAG: Diacylglycerol kinase [bacterium ADurb.Bin429]|nr:MAG: Diacylglycerol kinase [bacterium ADurb.Bin429]